MGSNSILIVSFFGKKVYIISTPIRFEMKFVNDL